MAKPIESIAPEISKPHVLNSSNNTWVVLKDNIAKMPSGKQNLAAIKTQGIAYSLNGIGTEDSIPAIVPGTILNSLLRDRDWLQHNLTDPSILKEKDSDFFDPFYDTNQQYIPDASGDGGVARYTYWYYTEFTLEDVVANQRFYLNLRGINYTADVFLNGVQLNQEEQLQGMFLRHSFDITNYPSKDHIYRLAIRIVPPDAPGTPSNRNGGELTANIGENVTMRHTVGWDWTMSIPDRSTGLWDEVSITTSKSLQLKHPKVTTTVNEADATVTITTEVYNPTSVAQTAFVSYELEGNTQQKTVQVPAGETLSVDFSSFVIKKARLWWPNGSDPVNPKNKAELYLLNLYVSTTADTNASLSDQSSLRVGMRSFSHSMKTLPNGKESRQFFVNGKKVFIRGGNWMGMDTLFRGTAERYKNEVRMHKEMNLNLIRVWGGGLIERPEFYEACDELGIMVMQEFWFSSEFIFSDLEPIPADYQKTFTKCATDSIRMLRNHASLLFWCAANESTPPVTLLAQLHRYIGEGDGTLDATRLLVDNSLKVHNDTIVGTDGPYGILALNNYFKEMPGSWTNPLNPEIGSLGMPSVESIRQMIRPKQLEVVPEKFAMFVKPTPGSSNDPSYYPTHKDLPVVNESWQHLKYSQYFVDYNVNNVFDDQLYTYGIPTNIEDYCDQAQLTNYMQYKAIWEGYLTHMWTYYTGLIVWKSQGSWTGLRAKLYDWFLEQNGAYWGVKDACAAVHVQLNLADYPKGSKYDVNVVNHSTEALQGLQLNWNVYGLKGSIVSKTIPATTADGTNAAAKASTTKIANLDLTQILSDLDSEVYFVVLQLKNKDETLSRNMYWLSKTGQYEEIGNYSTDKLVATAKGSTDAKGNYTLQASFTNKAAQLSFWNRLQIRKPSKTTKVGERILPVFYSNNYFSLMSQEETLNQIEFQYKAEDGMPELWLKGWNQEWVQIAIDWEK